MHIFKYIITTSICAFAAAPVALSQGFYADGGYAKVSTDLPDGTFDEPDLDEDIDVALDFDFDAIGGHVGYAFSPYISVEGEVLIGISDETISETIQVGDDELDLDAEFSLASLYGAFARGSLPIGERASAFARIGYVYGEIDAEASFGDETHSETSSGSGLAYGIGGTFDLTDKFYVRGDYTVYDIEDADVDMFMLGAGFKF